MAAKSRRLTREFHESRVGRCCQICGELQESRPANRSLLDSELKKVFPDITAGELADRPSRITCSACFVKFYKFRTDCKTNLWAAKNMSKEEKLAVVLATR